MSAVLARQALTLAALFRAAPDFPGRDTLLWALGRYGRRLDTTMRGRYSGGLLFEGNPARDGNVVDFFLLRYARPALAPVLGAALPKGSVFADAGANLGLYSLLAARCVGTEGEVHAFEPVPETYAKLERNLALNDFGHVRAVLTALGAEAGCVTLHVSPDASGVSSRDGLPAGSPVEVPVTTLDAYFEGKRTPDLIKIDVEGMEVEALRGASGLLGGSAPPLLVLETEQGHLRDSGTSYRELLAVLDRSGGYVTWALTPRGLIRENPATASPGSLNTLATRPGTTAHERVVDRLRRVHFPENQNA